VGGVGVRVKKGEERRERQNLRLFSALDRREKKGREGRRIDFCRRCALIGGKKEEKRVTEGRTAPISYNGRRKKRKGWKFNLSYREKKRGERGPCRSLPPIQKGGKALATSTRGREKFSKKGGRANRRRGLLSSRTEGKGPAFESDCVRKKKRKKKNPLCERDREGEKRPDLVRQERPCIEKKRKEEGGGSNNTG